MIKQAISQKIQAFFKMPFKDQRKELEVYETSREMLIDMVDQMRMADESFKDHLDRTPLM